MKQLTAIVITWMCCSYVIYAQESTAIERCIKGKRHSHNSILKTTVASPVEEQYDVKHVKLDISLTNESTYISGNVTTTAKVVATTMPAYVFELTDVLTVDSVKVNGHVVPVGHNGAVHNTNLPTPLPRGTLFTAQVFYHGTATPGNIAWNTGVNNDTMWGTRVTFTLSEPYDAREWWPCKQSLQDKIDSADIWITIPEGLKAGSNGLLQTTTPMPGNRRRYEWKTKYPIDYYLISASVAPYKEYSYYTKLSANDSVLIQNYIFNNPAFFDKYREGIDSIGTMVQFLSSLFGDYPFKNEKYGHCTAPFWGGMEHQTMTSLVDFNSSLTIHELAHQWFGDHVTCATWKDIWLNEGFASYAEYLLEENFRSAASALDKMAVFHNRALGKPFASIYVADTTNSDTIFDGAITYSKAAAVIHSLRFVIDNDALFFEMLRSYQRQFAFGNATTEDFKILAEQKTGLDLTVFFDQWIYKQGHPVYSATWNQVFDKVFIKIKQRGASPQSINIFHTPMEIKLLSPLGDSTIKILIDNAEEMYYLNWDRPMTGFAIDPDNKILNQVELIQHDGELGLNEVSSNSIVAYPSSTSGNWHVIGLNDSYSMVLTDMTGRIVWKGTNNDMTAITIQTGKFAPGMYFLRVFRGREQINVFKLIKE